MARAGVKREDGNTDVASTFDFNASSTGQFTDAGPYRVTLMAWCTLAGNPGDGVAFTHTHRSPAYTTNGNVDKLSTEIATSITLDDVTQEVQTRSDIIDRLSGSSRWEFARVGVNTGGGEYSLRLVVEPLFDRDLGDFDPVP